jgi:hypothetical protein
MSVMQNLTNVMPVNDLGVYLVLYLIQCVFIVCLLWCVIMAGRDSVVVCHHGGPG